MFSNSLFLWLWSWWPQPTTGKDQTTLALFASILAISFVFLIFKKSRSTDPPLPPGPRGLPLLGYLPFLKPDLHRNFTDLAKTYGPIYKLWLGNKLCVVISSPELVKQVVRDQDAVFANRDPPISAVIVTYGLHDIAFSNSGPYWRKMRKVFVQEMLSNANLDACYGLRRREVHKALRKVREKAGSRVDVGELMFVTVVNAVISMLGAGSDEKENKNLIDVAEIREVVGELMVILGKPNVSDFYPALARFDLQGIEKQAKRVQRSCEQIFDSIIEQRVSSGKRVDGESKKKDFLQVLLDLRENVDSEQSITTIELKGLLQDIVIGGTDTTSTTSEWVMTELMKHPEMMKKVQDELTEVVGLNNAVEESHLPKLAYLDAVVKETFRLHPALPLLVPRCPSQSSIVGGYTIPKGTRVFLNIWNIHIDPLIWDNPLEFKPERFLDNSGKFDYSGNSFMYFPFGSGRRICAGIPLAEKMLLFLLASFLHSFEWKVPEGEDLDLSDKFGIVIKKMTPLVAIPTPREKSTHSFASILAASILFLWVFKKSRNINPPLPPGPRGLPLLGYLPFLGTDLHRSFTDLAKTYGPIYKLLLGNKLCVVISSSELVKQVVRDQDAVFANRDPPISGLIVTFGGSDIAFSNNGPKWRKLRKIFVREMLSNASLDSCYGLRRQEVHRALQKVGEKAGSLVDVRELMFTTVANVIISMLGGGSGEKEIRDLVGAGELRELVGDLMVILGRPNISDIYPALARFDLQGIEKHTKKVVRSCEQMFDSIIEQRMKLGIKVDNKSTKKDFLQVLLELREHEDHEQSITTTELKGLLMDIVIGGTDTTSTMSEWVMAELMKHPEMMKKVQQELAEVVGLNNTVEESHLPKLAYLDAVVKETFRLHPPLPLLVPHCPSQSCTVGAYTIPKGTRVFLNVWAIHRDPLIWDNPLEFRPERFLDDSGMFDYSGNNFHFLPFGSGRRGCAGLSLAERMLPFLLASFLHSFEWKSPEGEDLDLSDKFGIVIKKMKPLVAIATPRFSNVDLYI